MNAATPRLPALFIFAHHDDELFISITMRRLMRTGGPVRAAWLTRGGMKGERRQSESRKAMELLGVEPENLIFFGLPDGHLLDYLEDIIPRLMGLLERHRPASVFVPAYAGGHQDHDTVQLAGAVAIRRLQEAEHYAPGPAVGRSRDITLYEFPLYHRFGSRILSVGELIPGGDYPVLRTPLKLRDRLLKQRLARIYKSQRLILYPLLGIKGGPAMLHRDGEPYRQVPPDRNYERPPHPGRLAYEYFTGRRFDKFSRKASKVIRQPRFEGAINAYCSLPLEGGGLGWG